VFADKRIPESPSWPRGSSASRELGICHVALVGTLAQVGLQDLGTLAGCVHHLQASSSTAAKTTRFLISCSPMHLRLQRFSPLRADERPL
jgi:hypothetical protein